MERKVPQMKTDEEAEASLDQDLSDLDFSQFKPMRFEFENKPARVDRSVPQPRAGAESGLEGSRDQPPPPRPLSTSR